jgi:hypothetical protein
MSEFNRNINEEENVTTGWDVSISDSDSNNVNAPRLVIGNNLFY